MALGVGRLWQRLHLLLTARGLAAQPLNQPVKRARERIAPAAANRAGARGHYRRRILDAGVHFPRWLCRTAREKSPWRPIEAVMREAAGGLRSRADAFHGKGRASFSGKRTLRDFW